MLRKLKTVVMFMYLGIVMATNSFSMTISPIYFSQRIDGVGGYEEYEIGNDSFNKMRYKISIIPNTSDKKLAEKMEGWAEIYPRVLTIEPKSMQSIKVAIKSKSGNEKIGEYSYYLKLEPIVIPALESKGEEAVGIKAATGISFSLQLKGYIGNLGDVTKDVLIKEEKVKTGRKITIENTMKRQVALDVLSSQKRKLEKDLIKLDAGEKVEKIYKDLERIEIKEAPTEIKIYSS